MPDRLHHFNAVVYAIGSRLNGDPIFTRSSVLAPVRVWHGPSFPFPEKPFLAIRKISNAPEPQAHLILKCAFEEEERQGLRAQMTWEGALARIYYLSEASFPDGTHLTVATMECGYELDGDVFGNERLLALCTAAASAHDAQPTGSPEHTLLSERFRELFFANPKTISSALRIDGLDIVIESVREDLKGFFSSPLDSKLLHGDVHHGNLMRFPREDGARNLLIDPKAVLGETLYDYANMLLNPNVCDPKVLERFDERFDVVAGFVEERYNADLSERLLRWVRAHACLSGTWHMQDLNHGAAHAAFAIAGKADSRLAGL